ncbi:MAG: cytochrome P450 [Anaerolineae bacterium]|nr:cytochrome P450 [Anaerolineae bacterium]
MNQTRKYDLYSASFRQQTHQTFAQMRADDPVFQQPGLDGQTPIWFVTGYAEVEQVLLDERHFRRDPASISPELAQKYGGTTDLQLMLNSHMLNRDGADHRRLRSLVGQAFTPKMVQSMRPRIEQIAHDLLDKAAAQGRMELVADYAFPLPITVIAELLGIPLDNQENFRLWSNAFVQPAFTPEAQQEMMLKLQAFGAYMQQLVVERRQQPGDDLLSALIHVQEAGDRLSEMELFSMLALLIVAGHETTVSLIGNATLALLQNPEARNALQADPDLIPNALEELLRYDSPVERTLTRFVAADTELGGRKLQKGDLLIAVLGSANRDESRFTEADRLDIFRRPNPHLAFGKGSHYCLGAPLARLEGEIALRTLFQRFPDLRLGIAVEELTWRNTPLFRALTHLPLTWGMRDE